MKILIKFPSRGRPEIFKTTLNKYISMASGKHPIRFVCSFDEDDQTMNTTEIRDYLDSLNVDLKYVFGYNKTKIEAINANLEEENFDILMLAADDLVPRATSYDDIIVEEMTKSPYGLDTSLFFISSMWDFILDVKCIMGKAYYDRFGYIYHPEYKSLFCDNEYTEVAAMLGRQIKIPNEIIFHDHISGDETFIRNSPYTAEDDATFNKRKQNNFGVNINENTND